MKKIEIDRDVLLSRLCPVKVTHPITACVAQYLTTDQVKSAIDAAEAAAREPRPVVACVGDEVQARKPGPVYISAPADKDRVLCKLKFVVGGKGTHNYPISSLTTPAGNPIEAVVPFRIYKAGGRWGIKGHATSWSLDPCKELAERLAKQMYPWYTGPAYVVQEDSHDAS